MFPSALGVFCSWGHIPQALCQRRIAPSGLPHGQFEIDAKPSMPIQQSRSLMNEGFEFTLAKPVCLLGERVK